MNARGAVAGIFSPVAFGWILDRTGSWMAPIAFSVGLLLFAIVMTSRTARTARSTPLPASPAWRWQRVNLGLEHAGAESIAPGFVALDNSRPG
jgi:hypothetical protein